MLRKLLVQLVLPLAALCALFCLLAFAPEEDDRQAAPLEVSVILRGTEAGTALRSGMEQAALDQNVELRFLPPTAADGTQEQAQLLSREVQGGADAVVLAPADRSLLTLAEDLGSTPLVTLETDLPEAVYVGVDNTALGQALGQALLNGVPVGGTAVLVDSLPGDNGVRDRLAAAQEELTAAGRQVLVCVPADLEAALASAQAQAVAAFEAAALEEAAQLAAALPDFPLLYGVGSTSAIVAGVERSRITATIAQNDFTAGYLAVQAAAEAARRQSAEAPAPLSFSLIRKENMYDSDNQKMLFPVT